MKGFLLAAGNGTRLRPLTDAVPKCLVPIAGVPMLQIWLQQCGAFGISDVLINLHAKADEVREYLHKHTNGIRVQVAEEPELLGSAGTLRANRSWVASEEFFWVFYADVLNCVDLRKMLKLHQQRRPAATLGVYQVPDPTRCGIVALDEEGVICDFVEKPKNPNGNLAFSGLMIGTRELLDAIPDSTPADIGFDVLPRLIGRMVAFVVTDYLIDIGTMENYQAAQGSWQDVQRELRSYARKLV